jgi:hypothetical protein
MKKENNFYNIINQLTQESKSLWRMQNEYVKDAVKDAALKKFWTAYAKEKEKHVEELKKLVSQYSK